MRSGSIRDKIYLFKHGKNTKINAVFGSVRYSLILLSESHVSDTRLIKLLASWRRMHERWFPAVFPVTLHGTRGWLRDKVIQEPDRILFMIKIKNHYIGHIGLYRFNFRNNSCEIDNIVRGIDEYPGIMANAICRMMRWGRTEFGITTYELTTTSDNKKALNLYQKLGFTEVKRIPLIRIAKPDRIEWQNAPKTYSGTIKRYNVVMKLPYEKI